jgi:hypothetical protein
MKQLSTDTSLRNPQPQTGPTTIAGKHRSRWNATTHGLLAKAVVITEGDGKESKAEFHRVLDGLRHDLRPEGMLEEILVERIATCYWRLRRALRAEVGEIGRGQGTIKWQATFERGDLLTRFQQLPHIFRGDMTKTGVGIELLLDALDEVKESVEENGVLDKESGALLMKYFGHEESGLWWWCRLLTRMAEHGPSEDSPEVPSPEVCKAAILKLLSMKREYLVTIKEGIEEKEHLELAVRTASLSLADAPSTDKILRYETTIERQLYRALNQLERLQRQRLGDAVPPPISIDLSPA